MSPEDEAEPIETNQYTNISALLCVNGNMSFSDAMIEAIWQKGTIVPNYDPAQWRKDACGAWIARAARGDRNSLFGWEVDHIVPESRGGGNDTSNLRPLQWENNAVKADGRTDCALTSNGNTNVRVP